MVLTVLGGLWAYPYLTYHCLPLVRNSTIHQDLCSGDFFLFLQKMAVNASFDYQRADTATTKPRIICSWLSHVFISILRTKKTKKLMEVIHLHKLKLRSLTAQRNCVVSTKQVSAAADRSARYGASRPPCCTSM